MAVLSHIPEGALIPAHNGRVIRYQQRVNFRVPDLDSIKAFSELPRQRIDRYIE